MNVSKDALILLFRKDVYLHRWAVLALVAVELAAAISLVAQFPPEMQSAAGSFLQGLGSIGTFVIAFRLTAAAEQVGLIGYLKSLPLTNDEIFASRFIALFGFVIVNCVLLNIAFLAIGIPVGWVDALPSYQAVIAGVTIQLLLGVLLIGVATLTSSEKAIWVPLPLVIILINVYAVAASSGSPVLEQILEEINARWVLYAISLMATLMAAALGVIRLTRTKRTLIG